MFVWLILVAGLDIAIFTDGSIRHTGVIPIAGDQVTNDIAMALRTPTQHAEEIKIRYACALTQLAGPDETIKVPSVGDRPPEISLDNRSRKSWSLAMTNCSRSFNRSCDAPATKN